MIRDSRSTPPIWIKWFAIRAPQSRSELNDSRFALRSPDLNQMIRDSRSTPPIWIKWFAIRAPQSRSELNDSRSAVQIWIKWLERFEIVNNFVM